VTLVDQKIEDAFVALLNGAAIVSSKSSGGTPAGHARGQKSIVTKKGDARILVSCSAVEEAIFGPQRSARKEDEDEQQKYEMAREGNEDDEKQPPAGRDESGSGSVPLADPNTASEGSSTTGNDDGSTQQAEEKNAIDPGVLACMAIRSGTRIRPSQNVSEVPGSVGGEKGRAERIDEDAEMRAKRLEGQRRAEQREQVRRAARRGVAFGFLVGEDGGVGQKGERRKCEAVMRGKVVEPSFAKGEWSIRWRD